MKRFLAVLLGLITFVTCFATAGCNNSGVSNEQKQNALIIEYYKAGYGELWIQKLAAAYTAKYGQEVITLPRSGDQGIENMSTTFHSGASETDLFFTKGANFAELYKGGQASNNYYTDITDVYDATIDGEGVKVKDKMYDAFEEFYKMPAEGKYYDDKYYFFPWVTGMMGIVVNMNVWDQVAQGKSFPRTTDEFIKLCGEVKGVKNGVAPFIFSLSNEYFTSYYQVFMNQYEGNEAMDKFYKGYNPAGERYEAGMVDYDGFKYALEFFEQLLAKEGTKYKYMHEDSASANFQGMQGAFLNGAALFSVNGDWLENEMITKYPNVNLAMLKTPVLSAVANKCSFKDASNRDEILCAVIDYVDGKITTKPAGCTDADIDYIREARGVEYVTGNELVSYIPTYSNQIQAAKNFLKFMASDEGMKIFRDNTYGCELPLNYTEKTTATKVTGFRQSINSILDVSTARFVNKKDKIYSVGGINVLLYNNSFGRFADAFSSSTAKKTAIEYYEAEVTAVDKLIPGALTQAGISK